MRFGFLFISRKWRAPPLMWALLAIELPLTVAFLALTGIADPDLYRTTLWQEGYDHGFNSDPSEILYSYANYQPLKFPLPWSPFITKFNLVIAVLSTFILLTKVAAFIVRTFIPLISFLTHAGLVAVFAYTTYAQQAPDYSDAAHPAKHPWYITRSCSISSTNLIKGYCEQAKATFGITIVMLALFAVHIPYAVWCMFPTREEELRRASAASASPSTKEKKLGEQQWEFQNLPRTPGTAGAMKSPVYATTPVYANTPYTPRTQAFQSLDGTGPMPTQYLPHADYAQRSPYPQGSGSLPLRARFGDAV